MAKNIDNEHKKNVLYLGNFGEKQTIKGSQVKKTVSISNYLVENNLNVTNINTENFKTLSIPIIFPYFIFKLLSAQSVVVSLNKSGIKFGNYLLLKIITTLKKDNLFFVTIGGWLAEFIEENEESIKYFKSFKMIYVQADEIKKKLRNKEIVNVKNIHNFRDYETQILGEFRESILSIDYHRKTTINIVFFVSIRREKGLIIAIEAIKRINQKYGYDAYFLDIIGPIRDKSYKKEFEKILQENLDISDYKGEIADQNEVYEVLSKYDFMVFPTYHEGEGFPTVIVESFISGLPVLASDWKYNNEIIKHGYNGLLFQSKEIEDLMDKLEWLYQNKQEIKNMRLNCLKEAEKYHSSKILKPILNDLLEKEE